MTPQMGHGQRRPVREGPALLALLITAAVLAGCASPATTGASSASPAHSQASVASTSAAARVFTSRHYGYTEALPAGWLPGAQATQQWNGKGAPGGEDSVVDLFYGPGGVQAWALAAPTKESLAAYARATIRAAAAAHPCPAVPQTDQAITIGGAPARLLSMQCPAGSGFLVETAVTIHDGTAFVFASQNPSGQAPTTAPTAPPSAISSAASGFRDEGPTQRPRPRGRAAARTNCEPGRRGTLLDPAA